MSEVETSTIGGEKAPSVDALGAPGAVPLILTKREYAAYRRVSIPTVDRWIADGLPVVRGGTNGVAYEIDVAPADAWLLDREEQKQRAEAAKRAELERAQARLFGDEELPAIEGAADLTPAARAALIKAQREHVLLLEKMRHLVKADDVAAGMATVFASLKQSFRTIPDVLQRQFGLGDNQAAAILELVDDRLNDAVDAAGRALEAAHAALS